MKRKELSAEQYRKLLQGAMADLLIAQDLLDEAVNILAPDTEAECMWLDKVEKFLELSR